MAYIQLNQSHFNHNIDLIGKHIGGKEKIALVLKDNAYGHGLLAMASMAQEYGLRHAVVRTLDEATVIEKMFETILVLADLPQGKTASNIHITVNDLSLLSKLLPKTRIELKIDTGMHRNGIKAEELEDAFKLIQKSQLILAGVFTHHRSADTLSSEFFWQKKNFTQVKDQLKHLCEKNAMPMPRLHSLNSAGTFREPSMDEDIVRVGIAAYGLLEMPLPLQQPQLRPILSLYAQKIHAFEANTDMRMGYNGKGKVAIKESIATYDLGYGDGLLRLSDDQSFTNNEGIAIIGRVSMDNIILNCTQESVKLFDNANDYAHAAHTIGYEVVTRLHPQIVRKVIK